MSPEEERNIVNLQNQIERVGAHTEQECAQCLKSAPWPLLPTLDGTVTFLDSEQLCSAGRVDVIVIAEILETGGRARPGAFVWELKAPQLPLFQWDTLNQACPSPELLRAENQLLHYHYSIANDGHFRDRWGIVSSDYVKLGGIVIGQDRGIIQCEIDNLALGKQLALQALRIRESVFYKASGLRLWTWDRIVTVLKTQTLSHRRFVGEADALVNVIESTVSSTTIVDEQVGNGSTG